MEGTCHTCGYYGADATDDTGCGCRCIRHAPVMCYDGKKRYPRIVFPNEHWCGDFKPKGGDDA